MARLPVPLLALLVAVLLAATGCGGSEGEVLPFEDIQASEIELTFDPSGTAATLFVDTSIDAVCAVAYGPTEDLGLIATDDDMAGGAHANHQPLLGGLEPDTEYFYRVQGVVADGSLFQSKLMTFRTPAADPNAAPGPNAAVGATVVGFSSEFSGAFAAANAVDGDVATEWSTAGDGDDAFIEIDLGRVVQAVAVGYHGREMTDGTAITETYTISVDGGPPLGPFTAGTGRSVAEVVFRGQVVRFDVATSTGGNTGAVEVAVYEAP